MPDRQCRSLLAEYEELHHGSSEDDHQEQSDCERGCGAHGFSDYSGSTGAEIDGGHGAGHAVFVDGFDRDSRAGRKTELVRC